MKSSEFALINKIMKKLPAYSSDVLVGMGDDAAVLKIANSNYLLATVDVQVEDVHFRREHMSALQIGQKAVIAAVSDIAAMGGRPTYILVSLIIPRTIYFSRERSESRSMSSRQARTISYIDRLYDGIIAACQKYHVDIIGGNISRGKHLVIDTFVLGVIKPREIVLRSGANIGDLVLLTGKLGDAPVPRIQEGRVIAQSHLATAMIDISDGLSTDVLHICDASGVGVRIFLDKLPISDVILATQSEAWRRPESDGDPGQARMTALHGGEEYELLFTTPRKYAEKLIAKVRETGTDGTVIGEILPKEKGHWIVNEKGKRRPLEAGGWDHLRQAFRD